MKKLAFPRIALAAAVLAGLAGAGSASAFQVTQPSAAASPASAAAATPNCAAAAAATSTATTQGGHMQVTVSSVRGLVQYRDDENSPWRTCTVGLVLGEGAEFRTGTHSGVQFTLPPNQTITLDRLGTMKVLRAIQENGAYHTDVGMEYGRTHYEVQAAGIEHESTVRTPNSTLAVRGTDLIVMDQRPFPPQAVHFEGLAEWQTAKRKQVLSSGHSEVIGDQAAADTALLLIVVDPNIAFARTVNEVPLVANLLSRGAVFQVDQTKGIPIVRGGTPPTDAQLPSLLPGRLDFVLRWDGPANLDLVVGNLAGTGEAMYPATGANTTKSGGTIPFDHQGGKKGGIEIGFWNNGFPNGVLYPVGVTAVSGSTVNWQIDAFLDGAHVNLLDPATQQVVTTLHGSISPGLQEGGIAAIGTLLPAPPPGPVGLGLSSLTRRTAIPTARQTVKNTGAISTANLQPVGPKRPAK